MLVVGDVWEKVLVDGFEYFECIEGKWENELSVVIEARDESMLDDNFWKKNLYPLGLVYPGQVEYTSTTITTYIFQILVLSIRDISDSSATRWDNNDNMIDNLNITDSILGKLINKIRMLEYGDPDGDDFIVVRVDGIPTADRVINFGTNKLDGHQVFLRLQVENNSVYC